MKRKYVQAMMTGMTAMLAVTVPVTTVAAATPEKEQTVYVNADQNGNVEKVAEEYRQRKHARGQQRTERYHQCKG